MSGGKLEVILRVCGFVLSVVAAIVVGFAKQTKLVPVIISPNLPPLELDEVVKWQNLSAFVYFFATNIIASLYGLISLVITLTNKNKSSILTLMIIIFDTVTVALLSSGGATVMAVGIIGYHGNSHVGWNKVCNTFGRFCKIGTVSSVLSIVGAIVFMLLIILAAVGLQKRPK